MSLTFRAVALQTDSNPKLAAVYFDIASGYPTEPPEVRGEDWTAPGYEGQYVGNRVPHAWPIQLRGFIRGFGTDAAERTADWRTRTDAVMAAFDTELDPGTLAIAGYMGITAASIEARTVNLMPGPIQNHGSFQRWSVELRAVEPWA